MWFTRVVLPLPRKPAIIVTGRRASCSMGFIGSEGIGCPDRRLADPGAECIGNSVQSSPTGAMPGYDVFDAKGPQALDGFGNDRFHQAAQMQSSHHAMER